MTATDDVAEAVAGIRERIAAAATRAGRDPDDVTLVAATKTVGPERITQAVAAGVVDLGENRAQELVAKAPVLAADIGAPDVRWHFLGHLQRNKVRALAGLVHLWQSVDRVSLGTEIARRAPGASVLVEVNLGGEAAKSGVEPAGLGRLVDELTALELDVRGLMAIPPQSDEPRRRFAELAALAADLGLDELSMGMSQDFEAAIEEGATIVRVGRAIFGAEARR